MKVNQDSIRQDLFSQADVSPTEEIKRRVDFLKEYTLKSGTRGLCSGSPAGKIQRLRQN